MKKFFTLIIVSAVFMLFSAFTVQQGSLQKLPAVNINNLDHKPVNTNSFTNNGKPVIIYFWATWAAPCKKELSEIAEVYENWQKESGVKLIAISIDDLRTSSKVKPDVEAKGWEYDVYLDENSDFKRAMKVDNIPHLFVLNSNSEIVWQTNVYKSNGEVEKLHEVVSKVAKGEKPE